MNAPHHEESCSMRLPSAAECPLTFEEQRFAEENHGLLLSFMAQYRLDAEHYGRLALRYLKAVVRYCNEPELQQYAFSNIVWHHLRSELSNIIRHENAQPVVVACEMEPGCDRGSESTIDAALWREIEKTLTYKQCEAVYLRNQGYSNREIAELCGVKPKAIEKRFYRIRKNIRLKEILL